MGTLTASCIIDASIEDCFNTSLRLDVELKAAESHSIKAIAGRTRGLIGPGETVTWKVRQFGLWVRHTTVISGFEAPNYFQDRMLRGVFRSFSHDHFFTSLGPTQTLMRDVMHFSMPWYLLGFISEALVVRQRLSEILRKRNNVIKRVAEKLAAL